MRLNEAAYLLGISREQTATAIEQGVVVPGGPTVKLKATQIGTDYEITEDDLDAFIAPFETQDPGRNPPVAIRRELQVEAAHRCAICRDSAPSQYHHMIDFAKLKHFDPKAMMAICGTCHHKCTRGEIDYKSQLMYKARLKELFYGPVVSESAAATNRQRDLKTLGQMFECIHSPVLDNFFERSKVDVTPGNVLHFYESFHPVVGASTFHLYDRTLYELVRDFDSCWEKAMSFGVWFKSVPDDSFRFITEFWNAEREAAYNDFHKTMGDFEFSFRLLCFYVRDRYPEVDLDETDKRAWREYVEFQQTSPRPD